MVETRHVSVRFFVTPSSPTLNLHVRFAAIAAGANFLVPGLSIVLWPLWLLTGLFQFLARAKNVWMGVLISLITALLVGVFPFLVWVLGILAGFAFVARFRFLKVYGRTLMFGVLLHLCLVVWGLLGAGAFGYVYDNPDAFSGVLNKLEPLKISTAVLNLILFGVGLGLFIWVASQVARRVRRHFDRAIHRGVNADVAALVLAISPLLFVMMLLPIVKFEGALLGLGNVDGPDLIAGHDVLPDHAHSHTSGTESIEAGLKTHRGMSTVHVSVHTPHVPGGELINDQVDVELKYPEASPAPAGSSSAGSTSGSSAAGGGTGGHSSGRR